MVVEVQRDGFRHHDKRALVELVVAELKHDVLVRSGGVLADDGAGELGQAIGEVDVSAGVVHRPSVAVAVRILPEHDAAESERAVVWRILGADEETSEPTALALGGRRRRDTHDDEQHESGPPVGPTPVILPESTAPWGARGTSWRRRVAARLRPQLRVITLSCRRRTQGIVPAVFEADGDLLHGYGGTDANWTGRQANVPDSADRLAAGEGFHESHEVVASARACAYNPRRLSLSLLASLALTVLDVL